MANTSSTMDTTHPLYCSYYAGNDEFSAFSLGGPRGTWKKSDSKPKKEKDNVKEHTRERLLKEFPCLRYLGLSDRELNRAEIKVGKVDAELRAMCATTEETGDGDHTDVCREDHWFHFFSEQDLRLAEIPDVEQCGQVLRVQSPALYAESQQYVGQVLHEKRKFAIVVEIRTMAKEFSNDRMKTKITIYRL